MVVTFEEYGEYRIPKRWRSEEEYRQRNRRQNWTKSLLDLEHNKIFGTTPGNWCRHLTFYFILYLFLFAIALIVYMPLYFAVYSKGVTILQIPSISCRPNSRGQPSKLATFEESKISDIQKLTSQIDKMLSETSPYAKIVLDARFDQCNVDSMYGYLSRSPCVLIKLNHRSGFSPQIFQKTEDLPDYAPQELIDFINTIPELNRHNKIWLACDTDEPSIALNYIPRRFYYTDHLFDPIDSSEISSLPVAMRNNTDESFIDQINNIIAVQLTHSPINTEITLTCMIFAKNIPLVGEDGLRHGKVQFRFKIVGE